MKSLVRLKIDYHVISRFSIKIITGCFVGESVKLSGKIHVCINHILVRGYHISSQRYVLHVLELHPLFTYMYDTTKSCTFRVVMQPSRNKEIVHVDKPWGPLGEILGTFLVIRRFRLFFVFYSGNVIKTLYFIYMYLWFIGS